MKEGKKCYKRQELILLQQFIYKILMSQISFPLIKEKLPEFRHARSTTLLQNYDPAAYPPDLVFAQEHGLSRRVGQYIPPLEDVKRCRCCLEPVHKTNLPLNVDLNQLFHCGSSIPLYFQFLKQCIVLLVFNFFILTLPGMIVNITQGQECGIIQGGVEGFINSICQGSVINIMNIRQLQAMQIQSGIFFAAVIANIIFIGYLQLRMDLLVAKYEQGRLKAVDYSFMVKGLPSDITISQIQKYVQDKMLYSGAPDLTITKIYIIYNFKNYLNLVQTRQEIAEKNIDLLYQIQLLQAKNLKLSDYEDKLKVQHLKGEKEDTLSRNNVEVQKIDDKIARFEEVTKEIRERIALGGAVQSEQTRKIMNFSGKVIITVNNRRSQQKVVSKNQLSSCWARISFAVSELLQSSKSKVVITRAPDPQDIIFANMGSKRNIIWKTRLLYSTLIFFLLCLDFLIVALAKKLLKEQKAIQNGNIIFSFINSIIVSLFCSLFRRIIRASEEESYYNTYSKLNYQIVFKLVLVFMINMLFTTLIANAVSFYLIKQEETSTGSFPLNFSSFVFDCFFLIVTNPVFSVFLAIFDHRHIRSIIKAYRIRNGILPVSQGEANRSFQNMNLDLCYKYGSVYRFLIFTAGIAILYPLSIFICALALTAFYWIDKYLLLRRYALTLKLNSRFSLMTQKILAQFPIYLSLTTLLVMFIPVQDGSAFDQLHYSKVYYYLSGIGVIISFVNYIVGYRWMKAIFRSLFGIKDREEEEEFPEYKFIENDLESDYSHNYPYFRVTKTISRDQTEEFRKDKVKQLRDNQKLGTLDLIKHYMSRQRYADS